MDVNPWCLAEVCITVGDLVSAWDYQEVSSRSSLSSACGDLCSFLLFLLVSTFADQLFPQTIEDLNRKILCSDMELERLRIKAHHELQKAKETIEKLIEHLEVRTSERDEARKQVQLCSD